MQNPAKKKKSLHNLHAVRPKEDSSEGELKSSELTLKSKHSVQKELEALKGLKRVTGKCSSSSNELSSLKAAPKSTKKPPLAPKKQPISGKENIDSNTNQPTPDTTSSVSCDPKLTESTALGDLSLLMGKKSPSASGSFNSIPSDAPVETKAVTQSGGSEPLKNPSSKSVTKPSKKAAPKKARGTTPPPLAVKKQLTEGSVPTNTNKVTSSTNSALSDLQVVAGESKPTNSTAALGDLALLMGSNSTSTSDLLKETKTDLTPATSQTGDSELVKTPTSKSVTKPVKITTPMKTRTGDGEKNVTPRKGTPKKVKDVNNKSNDVPVPQKKMEGSVTTPRKQPPRDNQREADNVRKQLSATTTKKGSVGSHPKPSLNSRDDLNQTTPRKGSSNPQIGVSNSKEASVSTPKKGLICHPSQSSSTHLTTPKLGSDLRTPSAPSKRPSTPKQEHVINSTPQLSGSHLTIAREGSAKSGKDTSVGTPKVLKQTVPLAAKVSAQSTPRQGSASRPQQAIGQTFTSSQSNPTTPKQSDDGREVKQPDDGREVKQTGSAATISETAAKQSLKECTTTTETFSKTLTHRTTEKEQKQTSTTKKPSDKLPEKKCCSEIPKSENVSDELKTIDTTLKSCLEGEKQQITSKSQPTTLKPVEKKKRGRPPSTAGKRAAKPAKKLSSCRVVPVEVVPEFSSFTESIVIKHLPCYSRVSSLQESLVKLWRECPDNVMVITTSSSYYTSSIPGVVMMLYMHSRWLEIVYWDVTTNGSNSKTRLSGVEANKSLAIGSLREAAAVSIKKFGEIRIGCICPEKITLVGKFIADQCGFVRKSALLAIYPEAMALEYVDPESTFYSPRSPGQIAGFRPKLSNVIKTHEAVILQLPSKSSIVIRLVSHLSDSLKQSFDKMAIKPQASDSTQSEPEFTFIAAVLNQNTIVGTLTAIDSSLHHISVLKQYQKKGIATLLLVTFESLFAYNETMSVTKSSSTPARGSFLKKIGFTKDVDGVYTKEPPVQDPPKAYEPIVCELYEKACLELKNQTSAKKSSKTAPKQKRNSEDTDQVIKRPKQSAGNPTAATKQKRKAEKSADGNPIKRPQKATTKKATKAAKKPAAKKAAPKKSAVAKIIKKTKEVTEDEAARQLTPKTFPFSELQKLNTEQDKSATENVTGFRTLSAEESECIEKLLMNMKAASADMSSENLLNLIALSLLLNGVPTCRIKKDVVKRFQLLLRSIVDSCKPKHPQLCLLPKSGCVDNLWWDLFDLIKGKSDDSNYQLASVLDESSSSTVLRDWVWSIVSSID